MPRTPAAAPPRSPRRPSGPPRSRRKAVKLSWTFEGAHNTLWVDSRTYMLLRSVSTTRWGRQLDTVTSTYQIRPATEANRKVLSPVIPAGFAREAKVLYDEVDGGF